MITLDPKTLVSLIQKNINSFKPSPHPQGTEEWLKDRAGRWTSSEIWKLFVQPRTKKDREAGIPSATAIGYIEEIFYERMALEFTPSGSSAATEWGHENEPLAAERYEYLTGNVTEEVGFIPVDIPDVGIKAGGSVDRLVSFDGILEIKCPYSDFMGKANENIANNRNHYIQMQSNLLFTGRQWSHYVVFDPRLPDDKNIIIQHVERDEEMMHQIAAQLMWAEKVMKEVLEPRFQEKLNATQEIISPF